MICIASHTVSWQSICHNHLSTYLLSHCLLGNCLAASLCHTKVAIKRGSSWPWSRRSKLVSKIERIAQRLHSIGLPQFLPFCRLFQFFFRLWQSFNPPTVFYSILEPFPVLYSCLLSICPLQSFTAPYTPFFFFHFLNSFLQSFSSIRVYYRLYQSFSLIPFTVYNGLLQFSTVPFSSLQFFSSPLQIF